MRTWHSQALIFGRLPFYLLIGSNTLAFPGNMILGHMAASTPLCPSRGLVSQNVLGRVTGIALRIWCICMPLAPVFQLCFSIELLWKRFNCKEILFVELSFQYIMNSVTFWGKSEDFHHNPLLWALVLLNPQTMTHTSWLPLRPQSKFQ